jgi:hypothetical protein
MLPFECLPGAVESLPFRPADIQRRLTFRSEDPTVFSRGQVICFHKGGCRNHRPFVLPVERNGGRTECRRCFAEPVPGKPPRHMSLNTFRRRLCLPAPIGWQCSGPFRIVPVMFEGSRKRRSERPAASDDRIPFPAFSGLAASLFFGLALSQKGKECEAGTSSRSTPPASSMTVTNTLLKE